MKKAFVFVETKDGKIKKSSLESLSLVPSDSFEVITASIGKGSDSIGDELSRWGVKEHFFSTDQASEQYNPANYQNFLQTIIENEKPAVILASSNSLGKDIFPRLAARFDMAFMSDITEADISTNEVKRPLYAGKCTAQVTFTSDAPQILLLRPNQISVIEPSGSAQTQMASTPFPSNSGNCETVSIEAGESEKLDLTEAEVIVSGGRGLKEADNFKLLHDMAAPMNATVGASRAVVDLGWVPHSLQVGQTGKTVAPNLYFAVGISGAIQHLAGMSGSKNIVAINKDEKAPIFQKATYGIVGDLFEVVPLLAEKLKSIH